MTPPRRFPVRYAAPAYEAVGHWLLRARAAPGTAMEYNQAVGKLWAACTSTRTLPSPKQFDHALTVARRKLDAAYARAASRERQRDLEEATAALNWVEQAASEAGLLA